MYQDEAGFGRISKLGSCWAPIGVGPHVHSHYIREFHYCYGAVDAHTGESFFLIAGGCNTEWMNAFLEELSQAYPDDYLLLVMDNAIWHKSSTLKIPTNIGFTFIPPYTPEMNPKGFILKSTFTNLFPHLFNGVHLWCVWRNKCKANISRNL
ncbi:degenerate transposase [Streptococcus pneumoniae]|nr:degenerate transposase [Streptococcus pneumoniae]